MAEEPVDIIVRLQNLREFVTGSEQAGAAVKKIGTLAEEGATVASRATRSVGGVVGLVKRAASEGVAGLSRLARKSTETEGVVNRSVRRMREAAGKPVLGGGMGSMLLGGLAGFASIEGIKSAVDNTKELAVNAESMHRVTGMSVQDAATWQTVVQAYGVNARGFAMSMRSLSTQIFQVQQGSKQSKKMFADMGISMSDIKAHGGDMSSMLNLVIDRFNKMPAGVDKTAVATRLFGRNWQALMPLMSAGSKAITEQRKEAEAYGVSLGGNATQNAMKLHEAQVKLQLATTGLEVTFAEHLAPTLVTVFGYVLQLYAAIRSQMTPAFNTAGSVVRNVSGFFKDHRTILMLAKDALIFLIGAWVLARVQIIAARAAMLILNAVSLISKTITIAWRIALIAWRVAVIAGTAAMWLFNAALDANPIALVILAVIALGAVIYAFRNHISDVINWVKNHWPLLLAIFAGPIGLVVVLFLHFRKQIIGVFQDVWHFVSGIPGSILHLFTSAGSALINAIIWPFSHAFSWIKSKMPHFHSVHIGPISVPLPSFQLGGTMPWSGPALVGERGPEVVNLPSGAQIKPYSTSNFSPIQPMSGFNPQILTIVQIDRREVARASGKFVDDRLARS